VISEFIIAIYSVQPDLTVYRILQHDDEENISQLFVATRHWGSGTRDWRDGPWEKTFRELAAEMVDLAPPSICTEGRYRCRRARPI
jgi:hypothetical protein